MLYDPHQEPGNHTSQLGLTIPGGLGVSPFMVKASWFGQQTVWLLGLQETAKA